MAHNCCLIITPLALIHLGNGVRGARQGLRDAATCWKAVWRLHYLSTLSTDRDNGHQP